MDRPDAKPRSEGAQTPAPLQRAGAALLAVYRGAVLRAPRRTALALLALVACCAYYAQNFTLDASADALLVEGDPDLARLRDLSARYGTQDLLVVTFTPRQDLFAEAALQQLGELRGELAEIEGVESVTSILDVPLVKSSDVSFVQMARDVQTLRTPGVDRDRARAELTESPLFRDLLISAEGDTTALLLGLETDGEVQSLLQRREALRDVRRAGALDAEQSAELARVEAEYDVARARAGARTHEVIEDVRAVLEPYRDGAGVYLAGVPMIADDMISFVRSDLIVFGAAVFGLVIAVLAWIFRAARWVVLPLATCAYAALVMIGLLGFLRYEVTIISSNFLALILILSISMSIHLVVRYRQLLAEEPGADHLELVGRTLSRMVWPCLYTSLTTILGFGSLVFSEIKPVQDFGWMMSLGLCVVFASSFTVFPALLAMLGKPAGPQRVPRQGFRFPLQLAVLTERHGTAVIGVALALAVGSAIGVSRLTVENSFINYFSRDTEIYRGMKFVDEHLGGTTPLEVLIDFDGPDVAPDSEGTGGEGTGGEGTDVAGGQVGAEDEEDFELDDWDLGPPRPENWFTLLRVDRIKRVHDYLDSLPEVGKVLSLASIIRVAEDLNDGEELDSFDLGVLYKALPEDVRSSLVDPYFDPERNEARIQLRVLDSREDLRRGELLARIESGLGERLELPGGEAVLAGTMVLYNNVLQSLYRSQIASLGAVLVGVALMLLLLFRSLPLGIIGIIPNLLAAAIVLGLMGWFGIPLDIMTITIAAIAVGIAVDNAIHYIYRYREEYARTGDYSEALLRSHASIGYAVVYTSLTIILGFSILVLSNFLPTIYFGLLTGVAIAIAMLAALTLLPRILLIWRPALQGPPASS